MYICNHMFWIIDIFRLQYMQYALSMIVPNLYRLPYIATLYRIPYIVWVSSSTKTYNHNNLNTYEKKLKYDKLERGSNSIQIEI